MKKLDLKETQESLLEILVYTDKILTQNNLRYSLAYGTLIGAARHKGFIPWDDDLDIVMPYNDYLRMLKLPELIGNNKKYTLHYRTTERNYGYPFAKIENNATICKFDNVTDKGGAFLDIFPMTPLPLTDTRTYTEKLERLHKELAFTYSKSNNLVKNTAHFIARPFRSHYRDKMIDLAFKDVALDNSKFLTDSTWSDDRLGQAVPEEWFNNYTNLEFESQKFKVITKYKEWLKIVYGDWRKFPPKEERIGHHGFELFVK